jgi:hypothetical protein
MPSPRGRSQDVSIKTEFNIEVLHTHTHTHTHTQTEPIHVQDTSDTTTMSISPLIDGVNPLNTQRRLL